MDETSRCTSCRGLDFRNVFNNTTISPDGTDVVSIGRRLKRSKDFTSSNCDMCIFFRTLAPIYRRRYKMHVRLFDYVSHHSQQQQMADFDVRQPFLSVVRTNSRLRYDDDTVAEEIVQNGVCTFSTHHEVDSPSICRISSSVDFDLIGTHLQQCINTHTSCRQEVHDMAELDIIWLIDCETHKIVRRMNEEQYLTLSYVWGAGTRQQRSTAMTDFRIENAPLTIQDAIHAVTKLGYRYLWVDRFCIDQNDTATRRNMIANMDLIYETSVATMVALHGDSDQSGLPGVSITPRAPQMCIESNDGVLISSCPPITTMVSNSIWNTRGWTYQEARLSRRCLFFSSTQVYIVCKAFTLSEAVPYPPQATSLANLLNSTRLDGDLFGPNDKYDLVSHDRVRYTKRKLTLADDALNAFRGILRRSQYTTFWGVPVKLKRASGNPHDSFAIGHLWTKRPRGIGSSHLEPIITTLARRQGFPTWSWTSLATEVHQDWFSGNKETKYSRYIRGIDVDLPRNEAQIEFFLEVDGRYQSLTDLLRGPQPSRLPEDSPSLMIKGHLMLLKRKTRDEHTWYYVADQWIYFRPELSAADTVSPEPPEPSDPEDTEGALILIQWNDGQRASRTRLVLMVLEWIDESRAQRKGILTGYRHEFKAGLVNQMPRTPVCFHLQ